MNARSGEYIQKLKCVIFKKDSEVPQITLLNLPSSAPTYPMSVRAMCFETGREVVAEFWKKGHNTKKLFYKEV
jgi:hypothetical protein